MPTSVTHSPDRTRPVTPFLTSAILGLRSALECHNLISSNSFAHRLGTGNSALRLAPGPVGLKPELRQGRSELIYKIEPISFCPNFNVWTSPMNWCNTMQTNAYKYQTPWFTFTFFQFNMKMGDLINTSYAYKGGFLQNVAVEKLANA